MKLKIIAALFAAALAFAPLASCGGDAAGEKGGEKKVTSESTGGEGEIGEKEKDEEISRISSAAPVKDFEGYNYRILSRDASYALWEGTDADAEEQNGDLVNDAVYIRNRIIEERYNINIINKASPDLTSSAKKAISSGSDEYDIMMGPLSNNFADVLSQGGMLADMKNIPYLDLDKAWYDRNANEQLSIAGKLYVTISDIGKIDKDATWSYLFNKKLISDLALSDPYQLVKSGEWTIDKMLELSRGVSQDLDGDGKMGMDDRYGYAGETYNLYIGVLSAGGELFKKGKDDLPYYAGLDEAAINSFSKLISMFGDKTVTLRADDYYSSGKEVWGGTGIMDTAFMENRILFFDTSMARVTFYRNMESDFGIIPPPKRDAAQSGYICSVSVRSTNSLCVPITLPDYERTGIITDALACESHYTLIPAYYELQLKTKFARDDESAEMLDIIFAGRIFDLGLLYDWGGLTSKFEEAMQKNSADIISALEKIEDRVKSQIEKTIEAYQSF